MSEIIYHEVEKILFEETSRDLLRGVSGASEPSMQDLVFIGEEYWPLIGQHRSRDLNTGL